jgi:sugar lactone lactonase YvrE
VRTITNPSFGAPGDAELVCDAQAELGEGPIWDPRRRRLVFVDIHRQQIHEWDPASGDHSVWTTGMAVSAIGLRESGGWVAGADGAFVAIDPDGRRVTLVQQVEAAARRTRMNDGAVDPAGRFWAGTMSLDSVAGQGTLYRLDPDASVHAMITPVTTSNGPAWSPDGQRMYFVDTRTRRIDQLDFAVASGSCTNRRTFVDFADGPGRPDGVIVDREGGVWVGLWLGHAVHRYRPDGSLDRVVPLPVACATKCAFGGDDLMDLYITTARAPLDAAARAVQPLAGGLFRVRPGVAGQPSPAWLG